MRGPALDPDACWVAQFDLDSLNQNKAVNKAGGVVGKYATAKTQVTRDSLQPYSEVRSSRIQRRVCGHSAM